MGGRGGYFSLFGDNAFNFGQQSNRSRDRVVHAQGQGDYTVPGVGVVDNAIVGAGFASAGIPSFAPHESSGVFSKVEFLQNIFAPKVAGAFQNTVLPLQPGLQQTFPWLALVAPQFEEYEFLQLMFYWRPMVSDFNSGTGQTGEIVMVTQYNPADPPFTDTLRAKSYDMAMSCKASLPMNHGVECDPTKNSGAAGKYVRTGPLLNEGIGTDLKQYDLGNLNVIVTGTPPEYNGQLLGELWVAYTVQLRKPKLPISTGDTILRDYFQNADLVSPVARPENWISSWPTRPIGYGSQNRINDVGKGLTIAALGGPPAFVLEFNYTVPTWYTGDMQLVFTCLYRQMPDVRNPPGGPGNNFATPVTMVVSGDCQTIKDIVQSQVQTTGIGIPDSGVTLSDALLSSSIVVGSGDVAVARASQLATVAHVRWLSTNNPSSRVVIFRVTPGAIDPGNGNAILGWSLDCSEYNSSFNIGGGSSIGIIGADGTPLTNPYNTVKPWSGN
jgi:hypothetical protein